MYLKYGDYTHPQGEPQISIAKQAILSAAGTPVAHRVVFDIQGMLLGSGQADIDGKIEALIEAYSKQNRDLILYRSDGSTASQHSLKVRDTRGGVWVTAGPDFPEGGGAEYANKRTYTVQVSGEIPVSNPSTAIMAYTETLALWGGGPRDRHIETARGTPIKQRLRQRTVYHATQSGSATGYRAYPAAPGPLFGASNLIETPRITRVSPKWTGTSYTNYQISWEYKFESASPLSGLPNFRP